MLSSSSTLIYIGNLPDLDIDEMDFFSDNTVAAHGTYTESVLRDVTVIQNDDDGNFELESDDAFQSADTFTYDLGAGSVTSALDNEGRFSASYVDENGVTNYTTISLYQTANGDTFARLPDGVLVQNLTVTGIEIDGFSAIPLGISSTARVACFVSGTRIRTARGEQPAESLKGGDLIATRDNGLQPLRWTGTQTLQAVGPRAPIVFAPGALGNTTRLCVSPQHKVLVSNPLLDLYFGQSEALLPAQSLVDGCRIRQMPGGLVTYHHLLFDRHELIWSEGVLSESLYPGDEALASFPPAQRSALMKAIGRSTAAQESYGARAAFSPTAREARAIGTELARIAFAP